MTSSICGFSQGTADPSVIFKRSGQATAGKEGASIMTVSRRAAPGTGGGQVGLARERY
jgi:hypothetical protein